MVLQDKYPLRKNGLEDKVFNKFKSMTQFIFSRKAMAFWDKSLLRNKITKGNIT